MITYARSVRPQPCISTRWPAKSIIDSVINALLSTSIFWEMKHNQKHQSRNNIIPLVECLHWTFLPECFFCEKTRDQRTTWTVSYWKNKDDTWQQIESQVKRMCVDRLQWLVKNKDLFATESKHHPLRFRYFRAEFANHRPNSRSWRAK